MSDAYARTTEVVCPGASSASMLANENASAIVSSRTCWFHNARNDVPRSRAPRHLLVNGKLRYSAAFRGGFVYSWDTILTRGGLQKYPRIWEGTGQTINSPLAGVK